MSANERHWSDSDLITAVEGSRTLQEVLTKIGLYARSGGNRAFINEHIRRLKLDTSHFGYVRPRKWSDDDLRQAVLRSLNISEVPLHLGIRVGGNLAGVKSHIQRLGLSTSHFQSGLQPGGRRLLSDVLVVGHPTESTHRLKLRLIREGLLPNTCSECFIVTWRDKPLSLHLDHVNGNRGDNRIENLRLLCPNCHSQTPTYAGKKNRKLGSSR